MSSSESEYTSEADSRVGTVLKERYRLDSVLGIGGMAIVYTATHRNRRRFAVKILRPELSVRADMRSRFVREGYIANTVGHPGAVAVLDDDVASDGAAFLVMELLEGAGLEQVWERHGRRIPLRAALSVGWQLLDVLAAAHEKAIVHRDIKPANLFVTRDGTLKVLDFGIARLRDAASEHATQSGTAMGTPAFMPPEQVLGKASQIDALTDIWAVGATLFTLVSGHLVHEGETPQELMIKSATVPPRSLASVSRELSPSVVAIIDRAIQFDRAARWPSATAMRDAIADVYRATFGEGISSTPLTSLLAARDGAAAHTVLGAEPTRPSVRASNAPAAAAIAPTVGVVAEVPPTVGMTGVDLPRVAPTVDEATRERTVAAPPISHLIGMTTSQPVSSEMPPALPSSARTAPPAPKRRVGALIAVALAVFAAGTTALVVRRGGGSADPGPVGVASGSNSAPPSIAGALPAASSAEPPTGSPPAKPAPSAAATPSGSTARVETPPPVNRPVVIAPRAQAGALHPPAAPSVTPVGPTTPASAPPPPAKPNCDPNYTIDSAGHRILKRECL